MSTPSPDKFDLHHAQRLLDLGQWLNSNEAIIEAISTLLSCNVDLWREDCEDECHYMYAIADASDAFCQLLHQLRACKHQTPSFDQFTTSGSKLTLYRPLACPEHRSTVLATLEPATAVSAA